jgi:hypothetical protein
MYLDTGEQTGHLFRRHARLGSFGPVVEKLVRPRGVEAVDPIAQSLVVHAADLGRLAPIHPVPDRRQRQQPPDLIAPGERRKRLRRIVLA